MQHFKFCVYIYVKQKVNSCIVVFDLKSTIFSFHVAAHLVPNDTLKKLQEQFIFEIEFHNFVWMIIRIMSLFHLDRLSGK